MTWPQFGKRKPIERRVVVMKAPVGPDGTVINIDERYIDEWITFGWEGPDGINTLLANHAAFAAWEATRNRDMEEQSDPAYD